MHGWVLRHTVQVRTDRDQIPRCVEHFLRCVVWCSELRCVVGAGTLKCDIGTQDSVQALRYAIKMLRCAKQVLSYVVLIFGDWGDESRSEPLPRWRHQTPLNL